MPGWWGGCGVGGRRIGKRDGERRVGCVLSAIRVWSALAGIEPRCEESTVYRDL